jgi:CRP/FNR family transcriptional regulator
MKDIRAQLSFLNTALVEKILKAATVQDIPKNTQILRQEQYVKVLPIVIKGSVKVLSTFDEKELLLYYIEPSQSCVMSFTAALKNAPSKVFAITEEDTTLLLIPTDKLPQWLKEFPEFNQLFYAQYDLRFTDLLETIQHVLVNKMDTRLYDYLKQKVQVTNQETIKISHGQIANELGTAREVISRVMKKLEIEHKVLQTSEGIKIID